MFTEPDTISLFCLLMYMYFLFILLPHFVLIMYSGAGSDMNPALPDTSMKLGRYVHKHELFEIFSLANQN